MTPERLAKIRRMLEVDYLCDLEGKCAWEEVAAELLEAFDTVCGDVDIARYERDCAEQVAEDNATDLAYATERLVKVSAQRDAWKEAADCCSKIREHDEYYDFDEEVDRRVTLGTDADRAFRKARKLGAK